MTRSQRRNRTVARHSRNASFALARPAIALGIHLTENPNAVKRGSARLAFMDGFIAELAKAESQAYSPLTVATPVLLKSGKPGKRTTAYTS